MDTEKVRAGLKLLEQGMAMLGGGPMDYYCQRLTECYDYLLTFAPHKVGDRVRLADTPVINERESWGWLGSRHFLVKGAAATVVNVEAYGDGFSYGLAFDNDSWINSHTREVNPRPPNERHEYRFKGRWIEGLRDNGT